jgi:hypothetical protein
LRLKAAFSYFIAWVIYPTEAINDQAITTASAGRLGNQAASMPDGSRARAFL